MCGFFLLQAHIFQIQNWEKENIWINVCLNHRQTCQRCGGGFQQGASSIKSNNFSYVAMCHWIQTELYYLN